jgi:hypothetical protein
LLQSVEAQELDMHTGHLQLPLQMELLVVAAAVQQSMAPVAREVLQLKLFPLTQLLNMDSLVEPPLRVADMLPVQVAADLAVLVVL